MARAGENHSINLLRMLAAILVVASHIRALLFENWSSAPHTPVSTAFYTLGSLGHASVIVFFVLSGYWVGGSVIRQFSARSFTWPVYLVSRLTRLWIVVLPALVLVAVVDHIGLAIAPDSTIYTGDAGYSNTVPVELGDHLSASALLGNVFFLQELVVPTFGTNGPLWSLAYEFWFYLLLPLALAAVVSSRSTALRLLSAAAVVGVVLLLGPVGLSYFLVWLGGAAVAWGRAPLTRAVAGLGRTARAALRGGTGLLCLAFMVVDKAAGGGPVDLLLGLATMAFLATLLGDLPWTSRLGRLAVRWSAYAHASFSLYAVHLPLVALGSALLVGDAEDRWRLSPTTAAAAAVVLALTMLAGWLFAQLTERHTDVLRRRLLRALSTGGRGTMRPVDDRVPAVSAPATRPLPRVAGRP
jgi:peptidoglycan/LPS O-acetylase OafA/YrhL